MEIALSFSYSVNCRARKQRRAARKEGEKSILRKHLIRLSSRYCADKRRTYIERHLKPFGFIKRKEGKKSCIPFCNG